MTAACGTVWLSVRLLDRLRERGAQPEPLPASTGPAVAAVARERLSGRVDYRLVMFGALLPDLIDKPLGWILFREHFKVDGAANSHLYGHTGLFALLLIVAGAFLIAGWNDPRLFAVGVAVASHLAVDPVTHAPGLLIWPLLGTDFPLVSGPGTVVHTAGEVASAAILGFAAYSLYRRSQLERFVRAGHI